MTVQNLLKEIVKDTITPILKSEGFKKSGNKFYKEVNDDLGWCIELQTDRRINSKKELVFTFNFGVFVPAVYKVFYALDLPIIPTTSDCVESFRISTLRGHRDVWYRLNLDYIDLQRFRDTLKKHITQFGLHNIQKPPIPLNISTVLHKDIGDLKGEKRHMNYRFNAMYVDIPRLIEVMKNDISQYVIPHFLELTSLESIIAALQSKDRYINQLHRAVLLVQTGNQQKGVELLKQYDRRKEDPPVVEVCKKLGVDF
ncbi:DUF4304 domain-containing protein [Lysinibacillus sp. BW-2-10]|uniref:DUF4304 domain-containing protein n=1 Tax=Lysinibacillus sp. BW-2-10 TaxID=2590030 RepID=UPI001180ECB5|nr:DUF4304 domain-containing protein [Lysinibacillus sp. BW-2-10]TSI02589.1 DUF4304 domain-containing protein [Lysinibacillus sp. BW-2-10]